MRTDVFVSTERKPKPSDSIIVSAWDEIRAGLEHQGQDPSAKWAHYRQDPLAFVTQELRYKGSPVVQWAGQRAILQGLLKHRRVSVRSSRKSGKTFECGVIAVTFLNLWPSVVITLSATHRQISTSFWGEIRQLYQENAGKLIGKCDTLQCKVGPQHYAIGFSTDRPGNVQGFHGDVKPPPDDPDRDLTPEELAAELEAIQSGVDDSVRLLYIIDEGAEVKQPLYEAIKGSLAGPNTFVLITFNPTLDATRDHEAARSHQPGSGYHRIKISAEPTPEDPVSCDEEFIAPNWLCRPEWLEERKRDWGEGSPLYKSYVWGMFAGEESEWKVCPPELLASAEARQVHSDIGVHVGVDLSRKGRDGCVASRWAYGVKTAEHCWRSDDAMRSAEIVVALLRKWGEDGKPLPAENCHVDAGGLGGPIYDRIVQMGFAVDPVDFGAAPEGDWDALTGETAFVNRRAELHWVFRRGLQEGLLKLPAKYAESYAQAQWAEYLTRVHRGATALLIQSKDEIKARYGRSPDNFDSDLIALSRAGSQALSVGGVVL